MRSSPSLLALAILALPPLTGALVPTLPSLAEVSCTLVGGSAVDDCAIDAWSANIDHGAREYGETVGVSPDGSTVFVAGYTDAQVTTSRRWINWTLDAYDQETGALVWSTTWDGPGALGSAPYGDYDYPYDLVVSPDSATVFVTGTAYYNDARKGDFATVAFSASTGAALWEEFYHGNGNPTVTDEAYAIDVSPDGATVVVTGKSYGPKNATTGVTTSYDWATIAYDASTGSTLWTTRQAYLENNAVDSPVDLEISPDGTFVAVGGDSDDYSAGTGGGVQYTTAVYEMATGAQRWKAVHNGEAARADRISAVAISPASDAVYVTGYSSSSVYLDDYATIRYDASTGAESWVHSFRGVGGGTDTRRAGDNAEDVLVSPDGATVYVTGTSPGERDSNNRSTVDFVTLALAASNGTLLWQAEMEDPDRPAVRREAREMAIASDGASLVVAGRSYNLSLPYATNFTTVAYDASDGSETWRAFARGNSTDSSSGARDIAIAPDDSRVFVAGGWIHGPAAEDIGLVAYAVSVPPGSSLPGIPLP